MPRPRSGSPSRSPAPSGPDLSFEDRLAAAGTRWVAGIDEVGRGPLAGPVVAAAVILDLDRVPVGLNDSKRLSATTRERLFAEILGSARAVALASVDAPTIDALNIRQATFLAMRRAAAALRIEPDHLLIDGSDVPADLPATATALVGGDGRSASIAAASIVAKVMRDRMMAKADDRYPDYGFAQNAGYGTASHRAALARLGPSPLHRRSFAPVREAEAQTMAVAREETDRDGLR